MAPSALITQGGLRRHLTSLGFTALHASALVYIIVTLSRGDFYRELLQVGLEAMGWRLALALGPIAVVLVLLLAIALLAATELRKAVRRWLRGEPEPDAFLRLRVLCYVAVGSIFANAFLFSTPETFSGPFRLRLPAIGSVTAALAYGAFGAWYAFRPQFRRVVPRDVRRGLDVAAMNVSLILLLAEAGLRIAATFYASPLLVTDSMPSQVRRAANRQPPGHLWFGFPMNQGGHYDTTFVPNAAVPGPLVVSIGDSFSYGFVPHAYHFTTVAERQMPGVEIYNMGYSAIGPSDYLYLVEQEALPLEPDLIVIQLFIGNDLEEIATPAGPTRWFDADRYLLAVVWHRLRIMARAQPAHVEALVPSTDETRESLLASYPFLADPLVETPSLTKNSYLDLAWGNAEKVLLADPEVFARFFEALEEIERAVGATPVKFVLIPEEFQVEEDLWEEVVRRAGQSLDRDLPQRRIVEWLEARELPVLDLLPLLRAVEPLEDGRRHLYHLNNAHFNARGNEIAGRALAGFLEPLPAATLPLHLDMGTPYPRRAMRSGWGRAEEADGRAFVWSDGPHSVLELPLPAEADIEMTLEALPFDFPGAPPQQVAIVLNGTVIDELTLLPGLRKYPVTLPQASLADPTNTVEFRYAYARSPRDVVPDSPDTRNLAVAWFAIQFLETDDPSEPVGRRQDSVTPR